MGVWFHFICHGQCHEEFGWLLMDVQCGHRTLPNIKVPDVNL